MSQTTVPAALEVHLPDQTPSKFERERRAFCRLLPTLLTTHRGQYVAIHDEEVIESGPVRADVVFNALARAKADIFVGLVSDDPPLIERSGIRRVLGEGKAGS